MKVSVPCSHLPSSEPRTAGAVGGGSTKPAHRVEASPCVQRPGPAGYDSVILGSALYVPRLVGRLFQAMGPGAGIGVGCGCRGSVATASTAGPDTDHPSLTTPAEAGLE
jgi:hypothetical protein